MTVADIKKNLTDRGIYDNFVAWYNEYFGKNGSVVAYYSRNETRNASIDIGSY